MPRVFEVWIRVLRFNADEHEVLNLKSASFFIQCKCISGFFSDFQACSQANMLRKKWWRVSSIRASIWEAMRIFTGHPVTLEMLAASGGRRRRKKKMDRRGKANSRHEYKSTNASVTQSYRRERLRRRRETERKHTVLFSEPSLTAISI